MRLLDTCLSLVVGEEVAVVWFSGHCLRLLRVINSDRRLSSFTAPEGISKSSVNHDAKIMQIESRITKLA